VNKLLEAEREEWKHQREAYESKLAEMEAGPLQMDTSELSSMFEQLMEKKLAENRRALTKKVH